MVYSGFVHFCFWQCSESMLTGSLPVHDAPPINFLVSGFLGAFSPDGSRLFSPWPVAEGFCSTFFGFLVELAFPNTM